MRKSLAAILFCFCTLVSADAAALDKRVVVVVWDGMRPDFINATNTPALYDLMHRGVFFAHNHSAYITSTEVNGTTLATGAYPEHSGIMGNREFWPELDALGAFGTDSLEAMRAADKHGRYLAVPTLAETLQKSGYRTDIAGTKPVVLLQDHTERADDATNVVLFEGKTLPPGLVNGFIGALGPFADTGIPKTNRDLWTTRALTELIWTNEVPAFSLLWLAEPDNTQHATGVGSPQALAAIRNSDNALSRVINQLKAKGVYDQTDIFVVSDHGFSTISREVDVAAELSGAGIHAVREFSAPPAKGDVLVIGLGGTSFLYVTGHDEKTIDHILKFLQTSDFAGPIFTARARDGTFALDDALIHSAHAPDIVFAFRWTSETNSYGPPGYVISESEGSNLSAQTQKATHATLSPFDLHNTLVAAGPDFRQGFIDETPSGNVDVAPTVLKILGVKPLKPMDGRVLAEAFNSANTAPPKMANKELQAQTKLPAGQWTQWLVISEVDGTRYLDQGNAEFTP